MSTKDVVGNGNAAVAESSARRMARAGARREPCMLKGHSSTKVGLEPGRIGKEPDVRAVRGGGTTRDREWTDPRMQGQKTLAGSGIVTVRAGGNAGLKAGSPIACAIGLAAAEGCHDPEPILTDLLSHG